MKIAAFADVHGNLPALDAVLESIAGHRPDIIACCGDLVGYGPFPNEVVERIKVSGAECVKGNYDDAVALKKPMCGCDFKNDAEAELGLASLTWTIDELAPEHGVWLDGLPEMITYRGFEARNIQFFHGSCEDINEYLTLDRTERLMELSKSADADLLIFGHTHRPFHYQTVERHFINVGSVGKPKDGDPRACWALIEVDGESVRTKWIRVEYDIDFVAHKIRQKCLPSVFADRLYQAG